MRTKRPILSDALAAKTLPINLVDKVSVRVLSAADAKAQCPDGQRRHYSPRCFQQVQASVALRRLPSLRVHRCSSERPTTCCVAARSASSASRCCGTSPARTTWARRSSFAALQLRAREPCRHGARPCACCSARASSGRAALVSDVDEIARPHIVRQLAACYAMLCYAMLG